MRGIRDAVRFCGRAALPALLAMGLFFPFSCVTTGGEQQGNGTPGQGGQGLEVFRSSRYLVVFPAEPVSAEVLAERYLGGESRAWVIEESNGGSLFQVGDAVIIPIHEENPGGLKMDGYQTVPILCYPRFALQCTDALCVSEEEFDRQMAFLAEQGYRSVTLKDLHEFLHYRRRLPAKAVVITIDDGYESAYEIAYPVLKRHGFTAVLFVVTDAIGAGSKALTWDRIREMKANGFEVGSHTVSYCDLTKPLKGESGRAHMDRMRKELMTSKQVIDTELGQDTMALAFPHGNVTPELLHLSESLGYRLGFTARPGANPFFADPLALRRNSVVWKDRVPFEEHLKVFESVSLVHTPSEPNAERGVSTDLNRTGKP